ncbi:MAG: 3'-5' exonuclease [Caldisericota bacterium]|nr:3'-5' exonuclease [Caldisericota bacterium]
MARTKRIAQGYAAQLQSAGLDVYEIKRNLAEQRDKPGVRLATLHRVKGLEFEHVLVVSANKGVIPLDAALAESEDGVAKRNVDTSERSLLYAALTRAKRSAVFSVQFSNFMRS